MLTCGFLNYASWLYIQQEWKGPLCVFLELWVAQTFLSRTLPFKFQAPSSLTHMSILSTQWRVFVLIQILLPASWPESCLQVESWESCGDHLICFLFLKDSGSPVACCLMSEHTFLTFFVQFSSYSLVRAYVHFPLLCHNERQKSSALLLLFKPTEWSTMSDPAFFGWSKWNTAWMNKVLGSFF